MNDVIMAYIFERIFMLLLISFVIGLFLTLMVLMNFLMEGKHKVAFIVSAVLTVVFLLGMMITPTGKQYLEMKKSTEKVEKPQSKPNQFNPKPANGIEDI